MTRRRKTPNPFATEAELCAAFTAALPKEWIAYNECCGWDILLLRRDDGLQIGIQAKLRLNPEVLRQAVEDHYWHYRAGPDYRAVLVPAGTVGPLSRLADYCGVTIIAVHGHQNPPFWPPLPSVRLEEAGAIDNWHPQLPMRRHDLPEYVPDVIAGVSSPVRLTKWKIAAMKLDVLLTETGYLTRFDFKHHKVDIRRWLALSWLQVGENGFCRGPGCPAFQEQHPRVWQEIRADPQQWQRPPPQQGELWNVA